MEKELMQLEAVLNRQSECYERLAGLVVGKLEALRAADHRRVVSLSEEENAQVQRIGELEKQRLSLVASLTSVVDPGAAEPLRMGELAERLAEPVRGRLLVLRSRLRGQMERVRSESSVARQASEALVRHMTGLVLTIGAAVTGVGVYGRGGAIPRAATAVSTFSATA